MKSILLLFTFLIGIQTLSAQPFTQIGSPLKGVEAGSVIFADVDGDNDEDVLISGQTTNNTRITRLYTNDGSGVFTQVTGTPFQGLWFSSNAFADIDGDNDQDLLITGKNNANNPVVKLYTNDGTGSFTQVNNLPFDAISGSVAFADVDGDNDQDVMLVGQLQSGSSISKLYTNDGTGTFTEVANTPFLGVILSAVTFADVDGDNDQDVMIAGSNGDIYTKLYKNDGTGTFTEVATTVEGVSGGSISFADIDGDNDQDVLVTGFGSSLVRIAKLYTNNGSGNFTLKTGTNFLEPMSSTSVFADIDNDNDQDLVIAGGNSSFTRVTEMYINDGTGSFSPVTDVTFEGVDFGAIAFSDIDGDNDQDMVLTGNNNGQLSVAKLYRNNVITTNTDDLVQSSNLKTTLSPNPVVNGKVQLEIQAKENSQTHITIFRTDGAVVYREQKSLSAGQHNFSIDVSHLTVGAYFIKFSDDKNTNILKFMVQ